MTKKTATTEKTESEKLFCGIVMPISEIDGCSEIHWKEVYQIVGQAVEKANFVPNLVSNSDDVGVIQKRIIQNLYDNPIVVVDVSGKNPNVMFELGIRLAFDKPTIIIKDDQTQYSFDTSPIEHIPYPRDLRFSKIVEFKEKLSEKIIQTYKKSINDENFSTFLKHFGSFKVAKIETEVVSKEDYILEEIKNLRESINRNNRNVAKRDFVRSGLKSSFDDDDNLITMCFNETMPSSIDGLLKEINSMRGVVSADLEQIDDDHIHIEVKLSGTRPKDLVIKSLNRIVGEDEVNYIR